jgi:ABC-type transporter Mla subunit MlaD
MDSNKRTEVVVGLVSLVGALLLIGGILIGEGFSYDPSRKTVMLRLDHSGGLDAGSPVVVHGVKRGEVTSVSADKGSVLARLDLNTIDDLRSDASAVVTILEITGGRKVEILPGTALTPFDPSSELRGRTAADLSALITTIGDVSQDLVTLLRRIDTIAAAATKIMGDEQFTTDVRNIAHDGATLVRDTREWMQQNRDGLTASIQELRSTLNEIRAVVKKNEPVLASSLQKLDQRLTELEGTLAKADRAILDVDSLARNVNGIVNDVRTNDGLLNAVLYDPSFKRSLDTLRRRVERFVEQARVNGVNVNVGLGHRP